MVESCVGSILLDTGFNLECVWEIMLSFLDPIISSPTLQLNPIRELQELCQYHSWTQTYSESETGSPYTVEVKVNGNNVCETASATDSNKKEAKKIAAKRVVAQLKVKSSCFFYSFCHCCGTIGLLLTTILPGITFQEDFKLKNFLLPIFSSFHDGLGPFVMVDT